MNKKWNKYYKKQEYKFMSSDNIYKEIDSCTNVESITDIPCTELSSCASHIITGKVTGDVELGTSPYPTLYIRTSTNTSNTVQLKWVSNSDANEYSLVLVDRYRKTVYNVTKNSGSKGAPKATRFYLTKYGGINSSGSKTETIIAPIDITAGAVYTLRLGETYIPATGKYKAWMRVYKPDGITWVTELPQ